MAEKDESSLIGYDPLAWLQQEADEIQPGLENNETAVEIQFSGSQQPDLPETLIPEKSDPVDADELPELTAANEISDTVETIVLDAVLNIQNVAKLHQRLVEALTCCQKIEIDASAVTVIDTAAMQLLLILKRTAIKDDKEVQIDFPSDKFIEAAQLLGIAEMLEVDQAAAGFF